MTNSGPMTGVITPENVVQFRAVPYATIPARFKQSVINTDLGGTKDFTKHGYASPQTFPPTTASGGPTPGDPPIPVSDEFKCLILQINVPLAQLQSTSSPKLPVLVYIHGGGFVLGRIDEQHNTALMVEQSIDDAKPIISASIQYRLGALGYLHTPEQPGNANLALHDQRNALVWLQRFITGFGGDREEVTLFGESGGSISICNQMLFAPPAEGRLFKRVVLMSGVLGPMTAPGTAEDADRVYETFLTKLGIEERGDAGLRALRELDVQKLVDLTAELTNNGFMFRSVQTEEWFGEKGGYVPWDEIPQLIGNCEWVDEIVLGTTGFEGTTFMARVADITPQIFIEGVAKQLGKEGAQLVCQAYNITPDMDQNLFTTLALRWVGDVVFDAPNHELAKWLSTQTNKKIYRYIFDVRNPFPNHSLYQQAHHWVDKYFLFKTLQFRYPTQNLKDISTKHAQLLIDFGNGNAPWKQYKYSGDGEEVIMVADERDGWVERSVAQDEKITELSWKRCEALVQTWMDNRGKPFSPLEIDPLKGKSMV